MYVAWWIFWAFIQSWVLHHLELNWHAAIIDSLVSNGLLALACFAAIILYRYYQPGKSNRIYRLVFAISITILYSITFKWIIMYLLGADDYYVDFLEKSMPIRSIISLLVLTFLTITNWLLYNIQEQKEKEQRRNDAEQLVKEAELARLRQQLQPHFLFNSLNSISALAGTKPNEARKMIQQLSDFLRGTLKKDDQQTVSLHEELEHLKLYLEIEKVRFGHRLQVEIAIEPENLEAYLPPLLLQPIVENAIKFGLYDTVEDITISISAHSENNFLHIQVRNPFDSDTQQANEGTGFGLSSVQRRLFLLYARNDLMTTEKNNNLFITSLKIPQVKK
ncbi:MAG: histidine kinase [Bacteroidetes bacterium]|nr:histidine kinase [Bacteroidota bacterium]